MAGAGDPQEETTFDQGGFVEISVDGQRIVRLEEISDLKKSTVDKVVLLRVLEEMVETERAELEQELDRDPEAILAETDPTVEFYNSDEGAWDRLSLD
jgi:hypothetical protein